MNPTPEHLRNHLRDIDRTLTHLRLADSDASSAHLEEFESQLAALRLLAGILRRSQEPPKAR